MTPHLVYGGTFDPVHDGHLAIARAARDEVDAPVWFVPAADPPHRAAPGASAVQRAEMLTLALHGEHALFVDLRELRRAQRDPEARSYTIDTLRELRRELGDSTPIALLLGADAFVGLPTWKQWRALFDFAHLVIAERPGIALDDGLPDELAAQCATRWVDAPQALRDAPAGRLLRLRQPLHAESATEVRERIARGEPCEGLLPAPVVGYIREHGLYAAQ